jgi:hypothetical protein
LGTFVVTANPGHETTYEKTPFSIHLVPQALDGVAFGPGSTDTITVTGTLSGKVKGNDFSSVKANFDPASPASISLGAETGSFTLPNSSLRLVPSTSGSGKTTAELELTVNGTQNPADAVAAPEPSTIALFLTTVGGLGLRRYIRARRRPA